MPVDFDAVVRQGGSDLIALLHFCVFSVQMEPIFAYLVQDYRNTPTPARALALYDLFCAPSAPARLWTDRALPPWDLRIQRAIEPVRQEQTPEPAPASDEDAETERPVPLASYLFDFIVAQLKEDADGPLQAAARRFDPGRTPLENLPGGKLSPGQRAFLERVWRPRVRPQLVTAGFWRIANIGG